MARRPLLAFVIGLLLASCVPDTRPAVEPTLAVTAVNVVDVVSGEILEGRTILVVGDRIVDVLADPAPALPSGTRIVDGTGLFAVPGLWDMHMHNVSEVADLAPWDFHRPGPGDPDPREIYLPIYLAFGVTGTREMSGGPGAIELRDRIASGEILGPHMVVGSPLLEGPHPIWPDGSVIAIDGPERAREVVDELHAAGFDFLKPYTLLGADSYRALVERAEELGMPVAGEVPLTVGAWEAAERGQRSIEHLTGIELAASSREEELRTGYLERIRVFEADTAAEDAVEIWNRSEWEPLATLDPDKRRRLYAHLVEHDTWVVPTLVVQRTISYADDPAIAGNPDLRYVDPWSRDPRSVADEFDPERRLRSLYDYRAGTIGALHEAGVGVLAGSDIVGGFTLHDELAIFVEGGMTPLEALRTATLNPARFLEREEELGTLAAGKIADLVLLRGNPLQDIRNTRSIEAVIFRGHLLERAHLDRMLEQLADDAEHWPEG